VARHKSFGDSNPYVAQEPVTFDLYGETFTCKPAVQGAVLLRFGKDTKDNPAEAVMNFFSVCMNEAEYLRFDELISSEDKIVDATTLGEIAGYLVTEYSARPTVPGASSSTGPTPTKRTSARKR
jgi:hypothetical protein